MDRKQSSYTLMKKAIKKYLITTENLFFKKRNNKKIDLQSTTEARTSVLTYYHKNKKTNILMSTVFVRVSERK